MSRRPRRRRGAITGGGGKNPRIFVQDPAAAIREARIDPLQRAPDMTDQSNKALDAQPTAKRDAPAVDPAKSAPPPPESGPAPQEAPKTKWKRKLVAGALGVAVLAVLIVFGVPLVEEMLNTVSTDDAFVNGHVTFVAPRVAGQISRVLVDDNNRVRKGEVLAELDKEPYQVVVSEKQAAVDTAKADLQAAIAAVRAIEAQAGADAGTCSTPWRMSTTRSLCCTRGSRRSKRARPR